MEVRNEANPNETQAHLETVHVKDILMESMLQSRSTMSSDKVREYETAYRNNAAFPPLVVTERPDTRPLALPGDVSYLVLDGWHRLQALNNIGREKTQVLIKPTPENASPHQLRWLGGQENLKNGLPLRNKEVRELFRAYVKAKEHRKGQGFKTYREIAQDIPLKTFQTIRNWMEVDFPAVFKAMGRKDDEAFESKYNGGKRYTPLPDLQLREMELAFHDVLEEAKKGNPEHRQEITERVRGMLRQLEEEAPYDKQDITF